MAPFAGKVALITGGSRGIGRATALLFAQRGADVAWKGRVIQATPKGGVGTPEDIAKVIAFLCSHEAEWICGQTIVADGGLTLTVPSRTA